MRTVGEIRRNNLEELIRQHGSLAELNDKLALPRTDATLSQIRNQSLSSRGKRRSMGDELARRIESALGLEVGWMDNTHYPADDRHSRIQHALAVMEHMQDWQVDQAIKILDTIAEPSPRAANGSS